MDGIGVGRGGYGVEERRMGGEGRRGAYGEKEAPVDVREVQGLGEDGVAGHRPDPRHRVQVHPHPHFTPKGLLEMRREE